ncbi:MAG: hypothetical protein DWQ02_17755 [Bacteroidetes bacterium]|nr:MAG: hypothetical protein DWQ02_17755 [Bacteroidota bacterium]
MQGSLGLERALIKTFWAGRFKTKRKLIKVTERSIFTNMIRDFDECQIYHFSDQNARLILLPSTLDIGHSAVLRFCPGPFSFFIQISTFLGKFHSLKTVMEQ